MKHVLAGVLLAAGMLIAAAAVLLQRFDPTCDADDAEVAMARSLGPERLARLHADAMRLAGTDRRFEPIPPAFSDLGVVGLNAYFPGQVTLRLRGCMDHHIDLVAIQRRGDDASSATEARVELVYDEPAQVEVLWIRRAKDAEASSPPRGR